jgi:ubiquinone/menaquinone biosynthesis C-methylase UbiE
MRRPEFIARQSGCPRGLLGRLIGRIMAAETAGANEEALELLQVQRGDRVLEVGFGHGRTIARAAELAGDTGVVTGIDCSHDMVRMARTHCATLIARGRVVLDEGDSAQLSYPERTFDRVLSVHTIYFWPDPLHDLRECHRVLKPGGRFVLGFRDAADEHAADFPANVYRFYTAQQVCELLRAAGFRSVHVHLGKSGVQFASATA